MYMWMYMTHKVNVPVYMYSMTELMSTNWYNLALDTIYVY